MFKSQDNVVVIDPTEEKQWQLEYKMLFVQNVWWIRYILIVVCFENFWFVLKEGITLNNVLLKMI